MASKSQPRPLEGAIHIFALFSIAIAHPLLNLLVQEDHATLLVAHQSGSADLLLLVAVLCVALPLGLCLLVWLLRAVSTPLGNAAYISVIWLLIFTVAQLLVNRYLPAFGWLPALGCGLAAAILVWLYARNQSARFFVTLLSPGIIVVPALFLSNPAIQPLLAEKRDFSLDPINAESKLPHILMLIFDELPLVSLLDANGQIDSGRYPNFAALAATSTWYRNTNTIHYSTRFSIPSILTGTDHWERVGKYNVNRPTIMLQRTSFPDNIFQLFEESHDAYVLMSNSEVSMPDAQDTAYLPPLSERFSYLAGDLMIVFGHQALPEPLRGRLPAIEGQWQDFEGDRQFGDEPEGWPYQGGKPYRIKQLIELLHRSNRPGLYVAHVVLPHHPYRYNEAGQLHENAIHIPDDRVKIPKGRNIWESEAAANAAWQAHLLQLGFVDRLLGKVLQRLADLRMFDDTLIVVTADHGISFYWDDHGLAPSELKAVQSSEVLNVPLFIKAPGQSKPRISDVMFQSIDILPTIADMLEVDIPWERDGISVLTESNAPAERYAWLMSQRQSLAELEFPDLRAAQRKSEVFGSGDYDGVYYYGPRPDLFGQSASAVTTLPPTTPISIRDIEKFTNVDPEGGEIPAYVEANWPVANHGEVDPDTVFVLSINGVIQATGRASFEGGVAQILFRVPPRGLGKGKNDLQIYEVASSSSAPD